MLSTTVVFGLFATAMASAIPASLSARIPDGVTYTVIAPEDIPDYIKGTGSATEIAARDGLAKRADYGVYLCTNAGWQGHCVHIVAPSGVCVPLADDLNDKVSSVGPDAGAYCRFNLLVLPCLVFIFFDYGCPSNSCDHFDLTAPGYTDLSQVAKVCGINPPNDKVSSYQCWAA
ncbi:uncharacterized protein B0I36DRAFT_353255 [Microdochium trichocladiopsis]|uniref:Uncharacterized protein n=1 Tax=Microdochium trichocladiopsis TaxID=1682393 RepID=A0A9P9BLN7_9PEZI|nr:uncharacterized protein B0I36DRAFT_353255 [Microdochium trichocladiopsis]KAH7025092.1 hypothetical protein B0I36DRAFT_353255 [Microdochium trichocladiopsis]